MNSASAPRSALLSPRLALAILVFVALAGCASTRAPVDLPRSPEFRSKLQNLLAAGSIDPGAPRVTLDASRLLGWSSQSHPITTEIYQKKVRTETNVGFPADSFGIDCKWNMDTPLWYTNYDLQVRTLRADKNRLALRDGICSQLQHGEIKITVGLYNFAEPFATQVPEADRTAYLYEALRSFVVSFFTQTDRETWEVHGVLVGEAAGFIYEIVGLFPPHSISYHKKTNNYYRLLMVSERTMAAMDVYGGPMTSVDKLQAAAWQVVQALRYEKPGTAK